MFQIQKILSLLIIGFLFIPVANATKFAAPSPEKIYSRNKYFYIQTNPGESKNAVMRIKNRKPETLWTFSYPAEPLDSLFITNNGKRVYVVRGKYVKTSDFNQPAVYVFSKEGLIAKHSYLELTTPRKYRPHEAGPIGDFWRVWRDDVVLKHGYLQIDTAKGVRYLQ